VCHLKLEKQFETVEPIAIEQDADKVLHIKNLAMTYDLM